MRVRSTALETLSGMRIVTARYGRLDRSADDEGYQCPRCGLVLIVTKAIANDDLAAFCCRHCGDHSVRAAGRPLDHAP